MEKRWLLIGFTCIFIGIILGAFGAHALKDALHDPEKLQSFETGVKYQIYHGLALIALVAIGRVFQLNFILILKNVGIEGFYFIFFYFLFFYFILFVSKYNYIFMLSEI
jgi:uncharacterized membrane protein YgdD (TMEM256/DUF423 family)